MGEPQPTLELLRTAELEIVSRLPEASNATFLARLTPASAGDDLEAEPDPEQPQEPPILAVYKPIAGERPLDDFPRRTLARREAAAYALSEATGWGIVPPTVLRDDGPFGAGMVQAWIQADPDVEPLQLVVSADPRLRRVCIFDALANNADRKASHLLPVASGHIFGVDHGICFSSEPKLRTVLWAWRGEALAPDELDVVRRVCSALEGALGDELAELLSRAEIDATLRRAAKLAGERRFPQPDPLRPAVPWPPY